MRNMLAMFLLAATVSTYAGDLLPVTVQPPSLAADFSREQPCITWENNGTTWTYQECGEWQIQNACVNHLNQITAWSAPKTMNLPKGWLLIGTSKNLSQSRAAVVWRATQVSTGKQVWLTAGSLNGHGAWEDIGDAYSTKQPYPWSGNHSGPYQLIPFASGNAALMPAPYAPPAPTITPMAPDVWLCDHPLTECEVAWSWVTHSGETALSPPLAIPASVNHSTVKGWRRLQLNSNHTGNNLPLGALGKYIYLKINGQWRRQVAKPWLAGETFVDKYLYAVNDLQPVIWSKSEGPVHVPPNGQAWSLITQEQKDLYEGKNVQVKGSLTVYSPIIIPYIPDTKVIGLTSADGGGWKLQQGTNVPSIPGYIPPNTHPTYWPLLVVQCADKPSGFHMSDASIVEGHPYGTRGPGFSLALGSCDTFGGEAFNAMFTRCTLRNLHLIWNPFVNSIWEKEAIAVGVENTYAPGGHTASEWKFYGCAITSFRQEGIQTVNFVLRDTSLIGYPAAPLKVKHGEAKFYGLVAAKVDTLFEVGWNGRVNCRDLFIDRPSGCLIDFTDDAPRSCVIRDTSSTCGFDFLVRSPINTRSAIELNFSDWADYRVNTTEPRSVYYHVSPNKLKSLTTNSPLVARYGQWAVPSIADITARVPTYQVAP